MAWIWNKLNNEIKPGQVFDASPTSANTTATSAGSQQTLSGLQQSLQSNKLQLSALGMQQLQQLVGPPPSPSPLPEESIVNEVVGWRQWTLGSIWKPELRSFNGTLWEPYKRLMAEHPLGPSVFDPAAVGGMSCNGVRCSCGIYAYSNRHHLDTLPEYTNTISGEVNLWGIVIEHKDGFRAQFAYPRSFVDSGFQARQMATLFGVKLIPKEELNEITHHAI